MFCSNCGNKLLDNANFCNECGAKVQIMAKNQPVQKITSIPVSESVADETPVASPNAAQEENVSTSQIQENAVSESSAQQKNSEPVEENKAKANTENENKPAEKKGISTGVLIGIVSTSFSGFIFLVGLITALAIGSIGNVILFISGLIEIGASVILYKIAQKRANETCPCCGTKRIHKRIWIQTDEKYNNFDIYEKITYTHHYLDTYTCPMCGEILEKNVAKSGGHITNNKQTGQIQDQRLPVREIL